VHAANFLRILLTAAALAAYTAWVSAPDGTRSYQRDHIPAADGIPLIDRAEAEALWRQPTTLFLDVRPATDFAFGHIEGAVHLPEAEIRDRLPALKPRLERAAALVVYCKSIDCGASVYAAMELRKAGLTQVVIYKGGWNEWVLADLPAFKAER
jgi:rhodanese-related sulfurtransferase